VLKVAAAATAALAVLTLGASPVSALTGRQLRTIHPEGPAAKRGIGPVRLEESQAAVAATLGPGREVEPLSLVEGETYSAYDYDAAGVMIEVAYADGIVSGVDTKSRAAMLFGHPLGDGLRTFRRILRHRRHWRVDTCHHRTFTALAPGGPGTGIEWRAGKVQLVMIDAGGVLDDCAVL
jgi:hypothetical protein